MNIKAYALPTIAVVMTGCEPGEPPVPANDDEAGQADASEWDTGAQAGCELVSDDAIRNALGEPVVETEEAAWYGCRWTTASFEVGLEAFADTSLAADSCAVGGQSMPYGKSAQGQQTPVEGLGDQAIWGSSGDLLVCTERGLLAVDMARAPATTAPDEEKDIAVAIAQRALGRLEPER